MDPDASDEMTDHLVDFFDQIASEYDTWAGGQHGRVAARLVELAAPKRGEHVLDVATGTGLVAHLVAAKVTRQRDRYRSVGSDALDRACEDKQEHPVRGDGR